VIVRNLILALVGALLAYNHAVALILQTLGKGGGDRFIFQNLEFPSPQVRGQKYDTCLGTKHPGARIEH